MEADIQEAIKKNLPAAVGEELRKRLALCDKLEKEIADVSKQYVEQRELATQRKVELDKHKSLDDKRSEIDADRLNVERREREVSLQMAELRASEAERRASDIFRLAEIAMGKRSFTEKVERRANRQVPDPRATYGSSTINLNDATTEERTVEEIG